MTKHDDDLHERIDSLPLRGLIVGALAKIPEAPPSSVVEAVEAALVGFAVAEAIKDGTADKAGEEAAIALKAFRAEMERERTRLDETNQGG